MLKQDSGQQLVFWQVYLSGIFYRKGSRSYAAGNDVWNIATKELEMSYVPVKLWVPDTVDGPTVESVNLKLCETCTVPIPEGAMDEHIANVHDVSVEPH